MIFADADFFIGLYYKEDFHHANCQYIINTIKEEFITSWDVIDETVTKLSYQTKKEYALVFLKDIFNKNIFIVYPTPELSQNAFRILYQQKSKHVSLTDCMNMAIAKDKHITCFLSFDKIYEKNGFSLFK